MEFANALRERTNIVIECIYTSKCYLYEHYVLTYGSRTHVQEPTKRRREESRSAIGDRIRLVRSNEYVCTQHNTHTLILTLTHTCVLISVDRVPRQIHHVCGSIESFRFR